MWVGVMTTLQINKLYQDLRQGNRRALAKALTLVESKASHDRLSADALFQLLPASTTIKTIALSGPPGAGKSTFIDAFGCFLIAKGYKVAVLAVDPSSPLSGGALLADKTRMEKLAMAENAFIRPTPTGQGVMGGISAATQDCLSLFNAAGYDYALLETVGVGQNESDARAICDLFCLILSPAAGDDLQGLKKGIVELTDVIIINKHDGDLQQAAERTACAYQAAVNDAQAAKPIHLCSSIDKRGFEAIYQTIITTKETGKNLWPLLERRLHDEIADLVLSLPRIQTLVTELQQKIGKDAQPPRLALAAAVGKIAALIK